MSIDSESPRLYKTVAYSNCHAATGELIDYRNALPPLYQEVLATMNRLSDNSKYIHCEIPNSSRKKIAAHTSAIRYRVKRTVEYFPQVEQAVVQCMSLLASKIECLTEATTRSIFDTLCDEPPPDTEKLSLVFDQFSSTAEYLYTSIHVNYHGTTADYCRYFYAFVYAVRRLYDKFADIAARIDYCMGTFKLVLHVESQNELLDFAKHEINMSAATTSDTTLSVDIPTPATTLSVDITTPDSTSSVDDPDAGDTATPNSTPSVDDDDDTDTVDPGLQHSITLPKRDDVPLVTALTHTPLDFANGVSIALQRDIESRQALRSVLLVAKAIGIESPDYPAAAKKVYDAEDDVIDTSTGVFYALKKVSGHTMTQFRASATLWTEASHKVTSEKLAVIMSSIVPVKYRAVNISPSEVQLADSISDLEIARCTLAADTDDARDSLELTMDALAGVYKR